MHFWARMQDREESRFRLSSDSLELVKIPRLRFGANPLTEEEELALWEQRETEARARRKFYGRKGRLRRVWYGMKTRCYDPRSPNFKYYGKKGITICNEWHTFENFKKWTISHGYAANMTIHRKDNDQAYSPDNCMWMTRSDHAKLHARMRRLKAVR